MISVFIEALQIKPLPKMLPSIFELVLAVVSLSGAAVGTLCNSGCACSQGKLPLPTPTKSTRSLQDYRIRVFVIQQLWRQGMAQTNGVAA